MSKDKTVYIVDGSRTPYLKARGKPGNFTAGDLAVAAGKPLLMRHHFALEAISEVILGCVMPGADEANIGRVAALKLGIPESVPAWTVQRNCASGMQAVDCAFRNIRSGLSDIVLAGGVESMSHAPVLYNDMMVNWLSHFMMSKTVAQKLKTITRLRPSHFKPVIALIKGLSDPIVGLSMGQTAENIAQRFNISRQQMDEFAVQSHQRLAFAIDNHHLDEVETIYDNHGHFYDQDDGLRRDSNEKALANLRPVFDKKFGLVTAGNSAQITDGACWILLASAQAVKKHKLPVLAKISDSEWAGLDPAVMGMGPAHAMAPLLQRNQLTVNDVDYWEINEAFAAQVLGCRAAWMDEDYCKHQLGLDSSLGEIPADKLNVDGGGVSLGHPVGSSGARIILHLAKTLERNNAAKGIASLCIGGGQGGAMLIEREAN
ncbi:MAG: acetyl-CoA C-acetyltransferase [Gammaproteobacteria bacterium]|nr:acetyl-CoA C-acetyltransferase [Gammaproteobacteria bacterium]